MEKKRRKKKKNKKQIKQDELFFYLLVLISITILSVALKPFYIFNISLDILIIPVILYLINYVYKNYGYKETLNNTLISTSTIIVYLFLIYNLENRVINIVEVIKSSLIYFLSIYSYLIINSKIKNPSKKITGLISIIVYTILKIIFY